MFDAYTIKKVIPRLVIAIIAIQLSWFLFTEMIQIVNTIAYGVEGLIYAPFGGREVVSAEAILSNIAQGTTFTWTGLLVGGGTTAWFLGPLGLLSLGLTIILALLIGVFLLSLRRLLIIALLLLAPIALVAWILPGTEKVWKIWWESFSKLLYIYPIILLLFAAGRAFGKVVAQTNSNNTLKVIVVMLAIYGPFFLIPKTFQLAGSAFANLAGIVNNTSRGLFDRNKKYRGQKIAENWEKTKNYQRFSDRNALTRGLNTLGGGTANPWRDLRRGRAGLASGRIAGRAAQGQTAWKSDAIIRANENDDTFLLALANRDLAEQKIEAAQRNYERAVQNQGADSDDARKYRAELDARQNGMRNATGVASRGTSATRQAALDALTKTGYQFAPGAQGYRELEQTIQSISGGDQGVYSSLMNNSQYNLKNAGRLDLAGINHGAGLDVKGGIRKQGNYQRGQGKTDTYIAGAAEWLGEGVVGSNGKTKDYEVMSREMERGLAGGTLNENDILEWHSMLIRDLPSATDANKLEIQKQIDAIENMSFTSPQATADWGQRLNQQRLDAARGGGIDPNILNNSP